MFDIGFLEILVIMVIALIVIGPERMPEVARKIGQFTGKTKRFINSMKEDSEISKTVNEIKDSMNLEEQKKEIESVTNQLQDDLTRIEQEWDVKIDEDISRPFSTNEENPVLSNQFNKAPKQPDIANQSTTPIPQAQEPEEAETSSQATPSETMTSENDKTHTGSS